MSIPYLYQLCCACCNNRMDPEGDNAKDDDNEAVCSIECLRENNKAIQAAELLLAERRE